MIFFCSDWHFNHDKDFIWKDRGFKTIQEMNKVIVDRHNFLVEREDEVYCLGDCCMGLDLEANKELITSMRGKIHIIRGNHDSDARIEMYKTCPNVVEICEGKYFKYEKYLFYLSHYPCLCSNLDADKPLKMRRISLCGHSHTTDPFIDWDKGLIYHVEMDAHLCFPAPIDAIIEDMKEKMTSE